MAEDHDWSWQKMDGYDLIVCSCSQPYLGARKMGTPCCCETCGFITPDQMDHLRQTIKREVLTSLQVKVNDRHTVAVDRYRSTGERYDEGWLDAFGIVLTMIGEAKCE